MFLHRHRIGIFYTILFLFCILQLYYSYQQHLALRFEEDVHPKYLIHIYGGMMFYIIISFFSLRKLIQRYSKLPALPDVMTRPRDTLSRRFRNLKRQTKYK